MKPKGGAIASFGATSPLVRCYLVANDTRFANNTAESGGNKKVWGGGLYSSTTAVSLARCTFQHNMVNNIGSATPYTRGGGLYMSRCLAYLIDCTFDANQALGGGVQKTSGAMRCAFETPSSVQACSVHSTDNILHVAFLYRGRVPHNSE